MKLDNDLVRDMLLKIEEDVDGSVNFEIGSYCEITFTEHDATLTKYHMKYFLDAGFVQGANGYFRDITPYGRDFLDNIRDSTIWSKTKEAVKPFGTVALDVVSEIAASIARKMFNLP